MSRIYEATFSNTPAAANSTVPIMTITGTAATRTALREFSQGSPSTPANSASSFLLQRHSTAPASGSAITPAPKDPGDPASVTTSMQGPSIGAPTTGTSLYRFPLNQNSTYRWVASDGRGFICPATANNGIGLYVPVNNGGLYLVDGTWEFDE